MKHDPMLSPEIITIYI